MKAEFELRRSVRAFEAAEISFRRPADLRDRKERPTDSDLVRFLVLKDGVLCV